MKTLIPLTALFPLLALAPACDGSSPKEEAKEVVESVKDGDDVGEVSEEAGELVESVGDKAEETVGDSGDDATDDVKDKAEEAGDAVEEAFEGDK